MFINSLGSGPLEGFFIGELNGEMNVASVTIARREYSGDGASWLTVTDTEATAFGAIGPEGNSNPAAVLS